MYAIIEAVYNDVQEYKESGIQYKNVYEISVDDKRQIIKVEEFYTNEIEGQTYTGVEHYEIEITDFWGLILDDFAQSYRALHHYIVSLGGHLNYMHIGLVYFEE